MARERSRTVSRREFMKVVAFTSALGLVEAACAPVAPPTVASTSPTNTAPPVPPTSTPVPVPTATPVPAGPKVGGILNYAETGEFTSFNPITIAGDCNINQLFSRLVWKNRTGELEPDIAESWGLSEDGLSYTVKLRENVKWHDGKESTAQDWVNMLGYVRDEKWKAFKGFTKGAGLLAAVKEIKAVDTYTVEFVFNSPTPYFEDSLDYLYLTRMEDVDDTEFLKKLPVGTGPFKITEWVPNQYARYERFDEYYQEGFPYLDGWRITRLDKSETLVPNLESGAVHGAGRLPISAVNRLDQLKDKYWTFVLNGDSVNDVIVNTSLPPFDNKKVRQALAYSMDRVKMVEAGTFGLAVPICTPMWNPASLGYREDLVVAYPFDLDKAAALLKEAGVSELETDIHVTASYPQLKEFCLVWQQDLAKIGITLNVREVEVAVWSEIGVDRTLKGNGLHPWSNGRTTRDPAIFLGTQIAFRGASSISAAVKSSQRSYQ